MCLYPTLILNPKFKPNKSNNYQPPKCDDDRKKYIPIGCQKCYQCLKQKSNSWRVRLTEELTRNQNAYFLTLTFSQTNLKKWEKRIKAYMNIEGYELENEIATQATRAFLERIRKKYKAKQKHWLVTEKGHNGTERIHLHGLIWTTLSREQINDAWSEGFTFTGYRYSDNTIHESAITYITKYITKSDIKHPNYTPKILCSAGIGSSYITDVAKRNHKFQKEKTRDYYLNKSYRKQQLPIYYRNKLFTEEQRNELWTIKLDENVRYLGKTAYNMNDPREAENFFRDLTTHQEKNKAMGYASAEKTWTESNYRHELKRLKNSKKLATTNLRSASLRTFSKIQN